MYSRLTKLLRILIITATKPPDKTFANLTADLGTSKPTFSFG